MNYATDMTLCDDLHLQPDSRSQISSTLLDKLNHQLNHEFFASHCYKEFRRFRTRPRLREGGHLRDQENGWF